MAKKDRPKSRELTQLARGLDDVIAVIGGIKPKDLLVHPEIVRDLDLLRHRLNRVCEQGPGHMLRENLGKTVAQNPQDAIEQLGKGLNHTTPSFEQIKERLDKNRELKDAVIQMNMSGGGLRYVETNEAGQYIFYECAYELPEVRYGVPYEMLKSRLSGLHGKAELWTGNDARLIQNDELISINDEFGVWIQTPDEAVASGYVCYAKFSYERERIDVKYHTNGWPVDDIAYRMKIAI